MYSVAKLMRIHLLGFFSPDYVLCCLVGSSLHVHTLILLKWWSETDLTFPLKCASLVRCSSTDFTGHFHMSLSLLFIHSHLWCFLRYFLFVARQHSCTMQDPAVHPELNCGAPQSSIWWSAVLFNHTIPLFLNCFFLVKWCSFEERKVSISIVV